MPKWKLYSRGWENWETVVEALNIEVSRNGDLLFRDEHGVAILIVASGSWTRVYRG